MSKKKSAVERAIELRREFPMQERNPAHLFEKRLAPQWPLLATASTEGVRVEVAHEVRRMFVVALATAFELYWRDLIRALVEKYASDGARLQHLSKVSVTIGDLATAIGQRLSLGEIIACAFSFQGPEAVFAACKSIFDRDVVSEFRKRIYLLEPESSPGESVDGKAPERTAVVGEQVLDSSLPSTVRCFEIRNASVHGLGESHALTGEEVEDIYFAVVEFTSVFGFFIEQCFAGEQSGADAKSREQHVTKGFVHRRRR